MDMIVYGIVVMMFGCGKTNEERDPIGVEYSLCKN